MKLRDKRKIFFPLIKKNLRVNFIVAEVAAVKYKHSIIQIHILKLHLQASFSLRGGEKSN
jgi:hypothetical protein